MTPLDDILIRQILAEGPMSMADYMAACLLHPTQGYYSTRDPFGTRGDFTTAPEISQMFGELLGLCLAQAWLDHGAPAPFTLAELGPGRGTLMADVLRATRGVPGFQAAAQVVLVEASDTLKAVQAKTLAAHAVQWRNDAEALPEQPLFLLANEFFDALSIHQFQRDEEGWRQRLVGVQDGRLGFCLSDLVDPATFGPQFGGDPPGTFVETCPSGRTIAGRIGRLLTRFGGVAIVIDYGGWRSKGDTLQALRDHRTEGVFASPGQADLTAHVDFEALATALAAPRTGLTDQGTLLRRLGIEARAERLARGLSGGALESHRAATHRLTAPSEMGSLFKAIAFHGPRSPAPPGFDPPHA